uniref:Uncharacterized protein n=1 Tax=Picea glauca TaxID=3330 RepID=A0A101LWX9_PICGL|nr:hypothetical protein ABT39_MTgene6326 [Picea glauca]QHR87232.1 hypothetical protein Q903MT_gene1241 [Picea sitchensis]
MVLQLLHIQLTHLLLDLALERRNLGLPSSISLENCSMTAPST